MEDETCYFCLEVTHKSTRVQCPRCTSSLCEICDEKLLQKQSHFYYKCPVGHDMNRPSVSSSPSLYKRVGLYIFIIFIILLGYYKYRSDIIFETYKDQSDIIFEIYDICYEHSVNGPYISLVYPESSGMKEVIISLKTFQEYLEHQYYYKEKRNVLPPPAIFKCTHSTTKNK